MKSNEELRALYDNDLRDKLAALEAMSLGARSPTTEEWAFMRAEMEKEHVAVQP